MPRLLALQAEWRARPPAHWLLAGVLKYRAPDVAALTARQPTIEALKAALG